MSTLTITQGLPGSGKTTWARERQAADPHLWRVNRDDLRAMTRPTWRHGDPADEALLTTMQHNNIRDLLDDNCDVIVDDTNLQPDVVESLRTLATKAGAEFEVVDFTHVPLEVCIERDAARPNPVGEQVIRAMHAKHLAGAA